VTGAGGFALDGGAPWLLPSGDALSAAQVTFTPDGGSCGTTIVLAAGPRRIAISVDWLTGRVVSGELREQRNSLTMRYLYVTRPPWHPLLRRVKTVFLGF
jgi:hypothetical protein